MFVVHFARPRYLFCLSFNRRFGHGQAFCGKMCVSGVHTVQPEIYDEKKWHLILLSAFIGRCFRRKQYNRTDNKRLECRSLIISTLYIDSFRRRTSKLTVRYASIFTRDTTILRTAIQGHARTESSVLTAHINCVIFNKQ